MMRGDQESKAQLNTVITWILAVMLIAALAGVVYVSLTPGAEEESYTEFYILGPDGNASDYPTNLSSGETGELIVGITNNEHREVAYTVVLVLEDETIDERTVDVDAGETWENKFALTAEEPGEKRLEILLFRGDEVGSLEDSYRELRLVIEVRK